MAGRRDWTGTLEELYETLSKFHDGTFSEMAGWPEDPQAFAAALKELEPKLADADLFIGRSDDGRLLIYRRSGENAVEGCFILCASVGRAKWTGSSWFKTMGGLSSGMRGPRFLLLLTTEKASRRPGPRVIEALRRGCSGQADAQECGPSGCVPISVPALLARLTRDDSGASRQIMP